MSDEKDNDSIEGRKNDQVQFKKKRRRTKTKQVTTKLVNESSCLSLKTACDFWIPLPKESTSIHVQEIRRRLVETGYTHAALTHTVFGAPKKEQDQANTVLPDSLWMGNNGSGSGSGSGSGVSSSSRSQTKRKEKKISSTSNEPNTKPVTSQSSIRVLRRLHAVLENLADVAQYHKRRPDATATETTNKITNMYSSAKNINNNNNNSNPSAQILNDYDLVSIAPRNDAVFQSVCKTAHAADIIVLDYTVRGLPFKIRPSDVRAALARHAVFEIPYAPAILNRTLRKGLVQTCQQLRMASLGCKPKVIVSSGSRMAVLEGEPEDVGAMALRTPADIRNVLQVVMKMDSRMAFEANSTAGMYALQQAHLRCFGGSQSFRITGISVTHDTILDVTKAASSTKSHKIAKLSSKGDQIRTNLAISSLSPSAGQNGESKITTDADRVKDDSDESSVGSGQDGFIALC